MQLDEEQFYTAEEACRVLGIKTATLYSYVNRGLITSYRQGIGRRRLYRREEIDQLLQIRAVTREETLDEIPWAESWATEH